MQVNRAMSEKFAQLVDSAEALLPLLPWYATIHSDVLDQNGSARE